MADILSHEKSVIVLYHRALNENNTLLKQLKLIKEAY
jgi:hypothetical protein